MWEQRGILIRMNTTLTSGPETVALFAVDWGTSSCRVWSLDPGGRVLASARSGRGTLALAQSVDSDDQSARAAAFEQELSRVAGDALSAHPGVSVLACGMVGSSLGWCEAGYIELPTGITIDRDSLTHTTAGDGRDVWIVPGLHTDGHLAGGYPDVIRGEETQLLGVLAQIDGAESSTRTIVLPGTHTKWVRVRGQEIEAFTTVMTGEFFSLLMDHSILGEPATPHAPFQSEAFDRGVVLGASSDAGSLMAKAFSARGLSLAGRLAPEAVGSYLSGLLLGDEVASQLPLYRCDGPIVLCGAPVLTDQYARVLEHAGAKVRVAGEDSTVAGLRAIARGAGLLPEMATSAVGAGEDNGRIHR